MLHCVKPVQFIFPITVIALINIPDSCQGLHCRVCALGASEKMFYDGNYATFFVVRLRSCRIVVDHG